MTLDRKDYKTAIPQLEKRLSAVEGVGKKGLANFDILKDLIEKEINERIRQNQKQDTSINTITVKMYYLLCDTGVTPTPETQGWSETMPKIDATSEDKVLWYMSKTYRNGAVIKTSEPQQVQIMNGVFAFINGVSSVDPITGKHNWTTIDGGTVATGRIQDNVDGDNYFDLDDGHFNFGDSSGNYVRQLGNGLEVKASEFLLSSGKTIQETIESVETWFYDVPPTTSNEPAVNWTSDKLKEQHLRDIYFDTESGKSYRWAKNGNVYSWVEIQDVQLSALAGRVSVNETNIQTNSQQIALRATRTELTNAVNNIEGLNVRMTTSGTNLVFNAILIQGGVDKTNDYPDGDYEWFYRTPTGDVPMYLNGKSITIPQTSQEYGRTVVCVWTRNQDTYLLTNAGNKLMANTGAYLIGRSEY